MNIDEKQLVIRMQVKFDKDKRIALVWETAEQVNVLYIQDKAVLSLIHDLTQALMEKTE